MMRLSRKWFKSSKSFRYSHLFIRLDRVRGSYPWGKELHRFLLNGGFSYNFGQSVPVQIYREYIYPIGLNI